MNTGIHHKGLPEAMEEIRSGQVFEVPSGYFEELDSRIFNSQTQGKRSTARPAFIFLRKYWPVAASVALLMMIVWWMNRDVISTDSNVVNLNELHDFIQEQIMEYDIETLAGMASGEETSNLFPGDTETLETYILEHLEDFETILY